ncbi:hypothetical protein OSG_eHP14_00170 [environmental Halophage eHP-14]|nr:hypothetical protein OSG_eHP14_00170 [environmental Halophage eHP-14]
MVKWVTIEDEVVKTGSPSANDFVFIEGALVTDTGDIDWATIEDNKIKAIGLQFDVTITATNSPVVEGDTLTVDADITNNGEGKGTREITLSLSDGVGQVDSTDLTLSQGQTKSITLTWDTVDGDAQFGDYTVTVESVDDSNTTTVNVNTVGDAVAFPDRYQVDLNLARQEIQIEKVKDGTFTVSVTSVSLSANTTYFCELDWGTGGTHTLTVADGATTVGTVTFSDSEWTDGGLGFQMNGIEPTKSTGTFGPYEINGSATDDYGDGDLQEYNGDTGKFAPSLNALDATSSDGDFYGISSLQGLSDYPVAGDTITVDMTPDDSNARMRYYYGTQPE